MKKIAITVCIALLIFLCSGCAVSTPVAQVAATTLPVYEFTVRLCEGTGITVTRLITEEVSCLHDYTLKTGQMRAIESAQLVVINGGGLEDFIDEALIGASSVIDSSEAITLDCGSHNHEHEGHAHNHDPHIWLSPALAKSMVHNIAHGLIAHFPQHRDTVERNEEALLAQLDELEQYGKEQLADLDCRKLITFHDGFSYFAQSYDLQILRAVEEESGSEASAQELIELINIVRQEQLPAIFVERSGSGSAADIIAAETGIKIYTLDMAMSGDSYFDAMYHNIDTIKEALG